MLPLTALAHGSLKKINNNMPPIPTEKLKKPACAEILTDEYVINKTKELFKGMVTDPEAYTVRVVKRDENQDFDIYAEKLYEAPYKFRANSSCVKGKADVYVLPLP
jgi:hypothetical protein